MRNHEEDVMNAMNQGERSGLKRCLLAAASAVSMLALHGCVYVGGGYGSWGGGGWGGGWHGGGGGWHGRGRCDVGQPEPVDGVRHCDGLDGNQLLGGSGFDGWRAG